MMRWGALLGLAGIALLTGLLIREGLDPVLAALAQAGFGLVWASLFHIVSMAVMALAWRVLFIAGRRPHLGQMTYAVWLRESVNGLLPVARIGGEVVSFRVLTRMGFKATPVVAGLIADITLTLVSQFLFTMAGLVVLLLRIDDTAAVWRVTFGLVAFLPMVAGLFAVQRYGIVNLGAKLVGALFGNRWAEFVGSAARLDRMIRQIYRRPSRVASAILWQLLGWSLGSGEIWLALHFMGHEVGLVDAFLLESLSQAISSAAFVVPGALGVQEAGFLFLGSLLGLDPGTALAIGIARRIRDAVIFIPGLVAWQAGELRKLWPDASLQSSLATCSLPPYSRPIGVLPR